MKTYAIIVASIFVCAWLWSWALLFKNWRKRPYFSNQLLELILILVMGPIFYMVFRSNIEPRRKREFMQNKTFNH